MGGGGGGAAPDLDPPPMFLGMRGFVDWVGVVLRLNIHHKRSPKRIVRNCKRGAKYGEVVTFGLVDGLNVGVQVRGVIGSRQPYGKYYYYRRHIIGYRLVGKAEWGGLLSVQVRRFKHFFWKMFPQKIVQ